MKPLTCLKSLADETRLRLARLLAAHEMNVGEIVQVLGMSQPRVSRHLKILAEAGVLVSRRDGLWRFFRTVGEGAGADLLAALAPHLAADPLFARDLGRAEEVVEERKAATRRFFDAAASDWAGRRAEVLAGFDLSAELARRIPEGAVAVDLGCGDGEALAAMARRAGAAIGVDGSPAMLQEARRRLSDLPGVSLRLGDLSHLPLADAEAGFASLSLVLHHLPRPEEALAEAGRVLSPGGALAVAEFDRHEVEQMRTEHGDRILGFDREQMRAALIRAGFDLEGLSEYPVGKGLTVLIYDCRKPTRAPAGPSRPHGAQRSTS